MSYAIPGFKLGTLLSASDLSSNQFYFGKINTSGAIALCGLGEDAIGVINNAPEASRPVEMICNGVVSVYSGSAISVGDKIACDATGRARTCVAGSFVLGTALEAASAAGELITVYLEKQGVSNETVTGVIIVDAAHGVASTLGEGFTVVADSQDGVFQITLDSKYDGREIIGATGQADVGVSYNDGSPDMSTVSSGILVSSKLIMSNLRKVWLGTYDADSTFAPTHYAGAVIAFSIKLQ